MTGIAVPREWRRWLAEQLALLDTPSWSAAGPGGREYRRRITEIIFAR